MKSGDKAWIALGAGVLGYDLLAAEGQTLSEAADNYMLKHPWLTRAVAVGLVCHVCNVVSPQFDLIHWGFVALRKLTR